MKLKSILWPEKVIPELEASTRDKVLSELVDAIESEVPLPKEDVMKVLVEREEQSPTAMSGGVAVPHGRLQELDRFLLAVGRSRKGVNFGAEDGPTRIFFLLMAPTDNTVAHLKILARIARICRNNNLRENIMIASSAEEIYQTLIREDDAI